CSKEVESGERHYFNQTFFNKIGSGQTSEANVPKVRFDLRMAEGFLKLLIQHRQPRDAFYGFRIPYRQRSCCTASVRI
ncbi:MAG: hypothetical protein QNJ44_24085, partial [Rhodobacter sp.]|nr:hypothetical protein [Rhodobacter sp.]